MECEGEDIERIKRKAKAGWRSIQERKGKKGDLKMRSLEEEIKIQEERLKKRLFLIELRKGKTIKELVDRANTVEL